MEIITLASSPSPIIYIPSFDPTSFSLKINLESTFIFPSFKRSINLFPIWILTFPLVFIR
nr:MAG TPA: hypothetical protein [Bacteriophage sp.]